MEFTDAQRERLAAHAREKLSSLTCSVCGGKTFQFSDRIFCVPEFHTQAETAQKNEVLPMVAMVCSSCYNIRFFGAIPIGLIAPPPDIKPKGGGRGED